MKKEIPTLLVILCCVIYGAISYGLIVWLNLLGVIISVVGFNLICNILEDRGF
jgi:hypothetical protein